MKIPTNQKEALTLALVLAITASTDAKTEMATNLAVQLTQGLTESEIAYCKQAAQRIVFAEET